ncbi:hypothetical protein EXIGLDRAFT_320607 [Exidia glandulosa HHB12029]|uniref:Uncharacterized protein n=1 Tax=Exidia glandulosa HHB12029 TaxID=1314781 RepID=A0A165Q5J6_EXIGL|nr:hypothetical protein EXIGLDRAFT_320607 [Exidia glandulosa HHB12029]
MKSILATTALVLLASAHAVEARVYRHGIYYGGGRVGFIIGMVILGLFCFFALIYCCLGCTLGGSGRRSRGTLPRFNTRRKASSAGGAPAMTSTASAVPPPAYAPPPGPPPAAAPAFPQPVHST